MSAQHVYACFQANTCAHAVYFPMACIPLFHASSYSAILIRENSVRYYRFKAEVLSKNYLKPYSFIDWCIGQRLKSHWGSPTIHRSCYRQWKQWNNFLQWRRKEEGAGTHQKLFLLNSAWRVKANNLLQTRHSKTGKGWRIPAVNISIRSSYLFNMVHTSLQVYLVNKAVGLK